MTPSHITPAVEVPLDVLQALGGGKLTAAEGQLVAALLTLCQSPGIYEGTLDDLAKVMRRRFKDCYQVLRRLQARRIIDRTALEDDTQPRLYRLVINPPSVWHA